MKILVTPDPFLRRVAIEVKTVDKKLQTQIVAMTEALQSAQDPEGVGLAATQVGINKRFFILNLHGKIEVFINPKITAQSEAMLSTVYKKGKDRWLEGCLSLPNLWGFVDRPYWCDITYLVPQGKELIEKSRRFEGVESSYALHEYDHLDGILFTDRILEQKGKIFRETEDGLVPVSIF
jgi:peptide deformylase